MQRQLKLISDDQIKKVTFSEQICEVLGVRKEPGWPDQFGTRFLQWLQQESHKPIPTLSLFSGAGGLDIGFQDSGFDIISHVEIEDKFVKTLRKNSNAGNLYAQSDICCIDIKDFDPPKGFKVDFIIGGPPCQTFSAAGRRAAGVQGTNDERGTLFEEYIRLLKTLKPKGFLFENVYGITGAQNGEAWREIKTSFREAGYNISFRILDAADYGVPQHRERLFIVGTREGYYLFPKPTHGPDSPGLEPHYLAGEAINNLPNTINEEMDVVGGRYGYLLKEIPPGLNYSFYTEKMGHPNPMFAWRSKFSDFLYKADPEMPVRTVKALGGQFTGPFHWENRPFKVAELKRLQTFPDDYQIVGNRQTMIQQIGNSVPPQLARILAISILQQLFQIKLPVEIKLLKEHEPLNFRKRKRQLTEYYRTKAELALVSYKGDNRKQDIVPENYRAKLTDSFSWELTELTEGKHALAVDTFIKERTLRIVVSKKSKCSKFTVDIEPSPGESWSIPFERIVLEGDELKGEVFTGAWKALEHKLITNHIKADLVQLCNYYQYSPAFYSKMKFVGKVKPAEEWSVVEKVVRGIGVRAIFSKLELSEQWGIPSSNVLKTCVFLRKLGYEIRNNNTNPQIPEGHYLVPYAFPTLTPKSVQLRKSLEV